MNQTIGFSNARKRPVAAYLVTGNLRHFPKTHHTTKIVNARQLLTQIVALPSEEDK
jgi:hypothetical protein